MAMYRLAALCALPLLALGAPAMAQAEDEAPAPAGTKITNSYICVMKDHVAPGAVVSEAARSANTSKGQVMRTYAHALKGFHIKAPPQAVAAMSRGNPNIAFCEQDQVVRTVTDVAPLMAALQKTSTQPAQTTPWGIARVGGGVSTSTATAWVIDSGIQLTHPDLNVDRTRSRSFLSTSTNPDDQNGHGTHVAGTIAARANTIGVIGVSPGSPVVSVRVLDRRGSGSNAGVIAGVDYVAANGRVGDVANMSLGGGISTALDQAVLRAAARGIKFALAAGNESASATTSSPGRVNGTNVYTVSSFAQGDVWSSFSNYGNPPVDWAGPGSSIRSTWIGSGYNTISGTSMATPHVAGLLLLGTPRVGGSVRGDPDGNPDPIAVR